MTTVNDLEANIGGPPWVNKHPTTYSGAAATADLREWCELRGMPQEKLYTLDRLSLEKCYCLNKAYFDTVAGNRPRNLAQTRRSGQQFRQTLDVTQVLNQADVSRALADGAQSAPLDSQEANASRQRFLNSVDEKIDQKFHALNNSISGTLSLIRRETYDNLKIEIETGGIEIKLGQNLQDKILGLVRNTADEIIFSALARTGTGTPRAQDTAPTQGSGQAPQDQGSGPANAGSGQWQPLNQGRIPELDPGFYFDPFASRVIRKAITLGRNVYAEGPTGCGKTALFTQICAVLGRGLIRVNPHDGITKESLIGAVTLRQENGASITEFQYGALPTAMHLGLVFLLDEADYLTPNLAAVLNPVTERDGKLYIPETGETITPAPGFCVLATANTGGKGDNVGQYTGTEVLNTAWLDRFPFKLKMDYLPDTKEREMLEKRHPSTSATDIEQMVALAQDIRTAFARGELSVTLSTRKLLDYFEQLDNGFSQSEALRLCLLSWLDDDDEQLVKTQLDRLNITLDDQ
jgi:cobaltochelatase CobS